MTQEPPRPEEVEGFGREEVEAVRERWRALLPARRRRMWWTAFGVIISVPVVVLLYLSIFVLPERIVDPPPGLNQLEGNQRVQAENALEQTRNSVRTTLVQAIAGGLVLLTFAVGLGQLFIAREGQVVDRFTNTIDQLGNDKIDVRLGGIYALKQIADRHEYRRPIAEIFVAYLKTHATGKEASVPGSTRLGEPVSLRPDLQAVLRILVGEELWRRAGISRLDLSYIIVRNADLPDVDLSTTVLLHAILDGSNMRNAKLRGADVRHASLVGADLSHADLDNADLSHAKLSKTTLAEARLTNEALLVDAKLDGAILRSAKLELVDATRADFTGANLINAILNNAVLTQARFSHANLSGADLSGANPEEARDLTGVVLTDARMDEVTRERINQRLNRRD